MCEELLLVIRERHILIVGSWIICWWGLVLWWNYKHVWLEISWNNCIQTLNPVGSKKAGFAIGGGCMPGTIPSSPISPKRIFTE